MRRFASLLTLVLTAGSIHAAVFTNTVSLDAFVRAAAPTSNYGGAGALSVSGPIATNSLGATNGAFDSYIRVNTAAMVNSFNSQFGTNNWTISSARLRVTELGSPAQAMFNRGKGAFEIRWIANDNWIEGTGTPNLPATNGVIYNDATALLNSGTDVTLGTFTNAGLDGVLIFPLVLPAAFISDLRAGGDVGLFLTAIDPRIGFTFDSRSFGTVAARPYLEITAVPPPGMIEIGISGADIFLLVTNGAAGLAYHVLTSTNMALPSYQWTSISTNIPVANGNFTVTLTNILMGSAKQQFFILRTE